LKETIHIQSEQARNITINRFCLLIAISAFAYFFIYIYLGIYLLSAISLSVSFLFSFFVYLNKKEHYKISRLAVIIATNVEVFIFSACLGFDSGIYLYLFAAPLLVYLLFDFNKRKTILFYLSTYIVTFFLIYINESLRFITPFELSAGVQKTIYACNFLSAFIMCIILVIYFANNNYNYILNLTQQRNLLQKNLEERELLLSEIHHRVKNNLAVISALLELQGSYINDEKVENLVMETRNRIKSIALLHEKLYENKVLEKIDIKEYIDELVNYVKRTFNDNEEKPALHLNIDSISLTMEEAMPLSLIINELISNSYRYASEPQRQGTIRLEIVQKQDKMHLLYLDGRPGLFTGNEINANPFSLTLIETLVDQLYATCKFKSTEEGFSFEMEVKIALGV
jgi:two-component sensor histidine kinase